MGCAVQSKLAARGHVAGIPSYGAASIFIDLEDMRAHGQDERIRSSLFEEAGEFTYRLMKTFSAAEAP